MSQPQPPLEYRPPPPRPQPALAILLVFLQVSAGAIMLVTGSMFWWALVVGVWEMLLDPPSLSDPFDDLTACLYTAPPFALGGILFVACSFRRKFADGRSA